MSKLVIVTHPNISQSVINSAWVKELSNHQEKLTVHSICEKYPDLKFDVAAEQELLSKHDEIVFQFPLHWFNVPYALKQYMDQVLTYGWAFGPEGDKMKGKKISFAVSTGGDKNTYESGVTLDELLKSVYLSFQFCGCEIASTHVFYGANSAPAEDVLAENAKQYAAAHIA